MTVYVWLKTEMIYYIYSDWLMHERALCTLLWPVRQLYLNWSREIRFNRGVAQRDSDTV